MLDKMLNTPLHLAAANQMSENVKELLNFGLSLNKRNILGVRPKDYGKIDEAVHRVFNEFE